MLDDAFQLCDFLSLALNGKLFEPHGLVGAGQHVLVFDVFSFAFDEFVMDHLIVSFDGLQALLQTFHLFLLIIEFTIEVTNLSLLALEHLLSRSKISLHLPLIAF